MFKKTITYVDYDGNERTEDFYFHLNKAELFEYEFLTNGGTSTLINKIIAEKDQARLVKLFKELILMSYGEKSLDGKRFVKNQELTDAFTQTEAYSKLFMELAIDTDAASEFVNGIMPSDIAEGAKKVDVTDKIRALEESRKADN